jgi:hypothetical protein
MAELPLVESIHFGFDHETLFLRVDPAPDRAKDLEGATLDVDVTVGTRHLRLVLVPHEWQLEEAAEGGWRALGRGGPAAVHRSLELGVPFARLGAKAGDKLELSFKLRRGELALGRYPADTPLEVIVPDGSFEAENWTA